MKKERKELIKLAKKHVEKKIYSKLKELKEEAEQIEALKYSLVASLEKEHHQLEKKVGYYEKQGRDVFFVKNRVEMAGPKIKHFKASYDRKDLVKAKQMLHKAREEMKHV